MHQQLPFLFSCGKYFERPALKQSELKCMHACLYVCRLDFSMTNEMCAIEKPNAQCLNCQCGPHADDNDKADIRNGFFISGQLMPLPSNGQHRWPGQTKGNLTCNYTYCCITNAVWQNVSLMIQIHTWFDYSVAVLRQWWWWWRRWCTKITNKIDKYTCINSKHQKPHE